MLHYLPAIVRWGILASVGVGIYLLFGWVVGHLAVAAGAL